MAAILVVFYHVARHMNLNIGYLPLGGIAQFGHAGVDFFFVLSGFIIFYVHGKDIGKPDRLLHYAQRRFTRIFPLYWSVFIIFLTVIYFFSDRLIPGFSFILQSFLLLPSVTDPFIGVAWSLQQEIIFYLIFAICIMHAKFGVYILITWLVFIVLNWISALPFDSSIVASKILLDYNIQFYFGIFAAWLNLKNIIASKHFFLILGFLLFFSTGMAENNGLINGYSSSARIYYGLSSFLMVLGFACVKEIKGRIGISLNSLGSASYSIYLTHLIFIGIFYKILETTGLFLHLPIWLTYLTLSTAGIVGGIFVSRFIEYPLMRFVKNHFFDKQSISLKDR